MLTDLLKGNHGKRSIKFENISRLDYSAIILMMVRQNHRRIFQQIALKKWRDQPHVVLVKKIERLVQIKKARLKNDRAEKLNHSPLPVGHSACLPLNEAGYQLVHRMLSELSGWNTGELADILGST